MGITKSRGKPVYSFIDHKASDEEIAAFIAALTGENPAKGTVEPIKTKKKRPAGRSKAKKG